MTREQYHALRRAAGQPRAGVDPALANLEYADNSSWVVGESSRLRAIRQAELDRAVPRPYCHAERVFAEQQALRRRHVMARIGERHHRQRIERAVQAALVLTRQLDAQIAASRAAAEAA